MIAAAIVALLLCGVLSGVQRYTGVSNLVSALVLEFFVVLANADVRLSYNSLF